MGIGISISASFNLGRPLAVADAPASTSTPPPPPPWHLSRPWVLLPSVPAAAAVSGFIPEDAADNTPRRIPILYPYIAAADPSGILLMCTDQHSDRPCYSLWDAATYTASQLPRLDPHYHHIRHPCGVGLMLRDNGQVLVADLQFASTRIATLLCYTSESRRWGVKRLRLRSSEHLASWFSHSVVSYAGRLWWADLSQGICSCDPFAEEPDLHYTPLPQGCKLSLRSSNTCLDLVKRRCLKVSGGEMRYIQVHEVPHGGYIVSVWTLAADPDSEDPWVFNYTSPLDWLFADSTFKGCVPLLQEAPMLGLIHPFDPNIMYFWHDSRIFAADIRSRKVLEHHFLHIDATSCSIHAWEVSDALQQRLEGTGIALTATSGMTLFTKPQDENLQEQMLFHPDSVTDIVSHADLGSVIRLAGSCKLLRRYILHPSYVHCLNLRPRFASSVFLGHFLSFRDNVHLRLQFVSTPHYTQSKLLSKIDSTMSDGHMIGDLDGFSPLGSDGGFIVLREHMDPSLCVWNPLTKACVYLPTVADGITRRSSCILQVNGTSFQLILIKLRLNRSELQTQTFISPEKVFSLASSRNIPIASGVWTEVSMRPVPGPTAKIAKPRAFPVVMNCVAYWLCKRAGKYVILKMKLDTQDPTFINVPVQCSLTSQFHRNNILLVPVSAGGRIGRISLDGLLGLVALDYDDFTIWMMSNTGEWVQRAVIPRARVLKSLGILPTLKQVQLELVWCANASGFMLVNVWGFGSAIINLNTLEAGFVKKTAVEREEPFIRIRSSCPYEFDFVSCLSSMASF